MLPFRQSTLQRTTVLTVECPIPSCLNIGTHPRRLFRNAGCCCDSHIFLRNSLKMLETLRLPETVARRFSGQQGTNEARSPFLVTIAKLHDYTEDIVSERIIVGE